MEEEQAQAESTEKVKSLPDHSEPRQQTAVSPASKDRFCMNERANALSAGK